MADTTAKVILEAILRDEDAKKELLKLQKATGGVGDAGKKVGKQSKGWLASMKAGWLAIAAVVVGVARVVSRFGKAAIAAAEENEVAQLKFQKVFKGSMDVARKSVADLTSHYAMSNTEATKMMSGIQDMLVPMGLMRSEAAKMSGSVIKLTADIAQFNGKPTAEVMTAIQSAMVGMNRPMLSLGVTMTALSVKQEAVNLGLHRGTGELNAAARAQAALSLIQKGSTDALGAVADQWDTWALSMKRVKSFGDDVTNLIGDKLVVAFKPALAQLTKFIGTGEGLQKISKWIGWVIHGVKMLGDVFMALWSVVRTVWSFFNVGLFIPIKNALLAIGKTIKLVFTGEWKEIGKVWKEQAGALADEVIDALKKRMAVHKAQIQKIVDDANNIYHAGEETRAEDEKQSDESRYADQMERLRAYLGTKEEAEIEFGERANERDRTWAEIHRVMDTETFKLFANLAKQAFGEINKLRQANLKRDVAATKRSRDVRIKALDDQLAAGIITEEEYNTARTEAERTAEVEIAKARRKAFYAEKKGKIAQIAMATALGIMNAFRLGPIAGAIAAAVITGLGIVQVATVNAQRPPPIPALAEGGIVRSPTVAMIGEKGPEAVTPLPPGFADALAGGGDTNNNMGGVTIVVEGAGDPSAVADAIYEKQLAVADSLGQGNPYRD